MKAAVSNTKTQSRLRHLQPACRAGKYSHAASGHADQAPTRSLCERTNMCCSTLDRCSLAEPHRVQHHVPEAWRSAMGDSNDPSPATLTGTLESTAPISPAPGTRQSSACRPWKICCSVWKGQQVPCHLGLAPAAMPLLQQRPLWHMRNLAVVPCPCW